MNRDRFSDGRSSGGSASRQRYSFRGGAIKHPSVVLARKARGWELGLPSYIEFGTPLRRIEPPAIIAVGGGKGGVGKSLIAANLAARMAASGFNVVCFDLDIGGSNLHTYFGIKHASATLADVAVFQRRSLSDCLTPTGIEGLRLVAGGRDECWSVSEGIAPTILKRVCQEILGLRSSQKTDVVILDLGAGTSRHTIDFFSLAHLGLLSVLPEPTSIENAYLFLRSFLLSLVRQVGKRLGTEDAAKDVLEQMIQAPRGRAGATSDSAMQTLSYVERLAELKGLYPHFIHEIQEAMQARLVGVVINQTRGQKDVDIGRSMEVIGERYFGFPTRYCGWLSHDEAAWKSLRNQKLLILDFPQSNLARRIYELMETVLKHLGYP